jgi:hypothetical protein
LALRRLYYRKCWWEDRDMTLALTLAGFLWVCCWIGLGARRLVGTKGKERVERVKVLLIAFTGSTFVLMFACVRRPHTAVFVFALWCHHAAILGLFVFLASSQLLQMEAQRSLKTRDFKAAARAGHGLWVLTEIAPAPIAIAILLTGLRLVWGGAVSDPPAVGKSPSTLWLVLIISGFSFFFWDGIFGYTPIVDRWRARLEALREGDSVAGAMPVSERLQLFGHFVSWPLVFVCGVYRWDTANPISSAVEGAIGALGSLPKGWPEVLMALAIWLAAGAAVFGSRQLGRRVTARRRSREVSGQGAHS